MLVRGFRLPMFIAWILILGVVAYVGTHPHLLAPFASRLLSRHLLQDIDGQLRMADFRVRPFKGLDIYGLTLTTHSESGGVALVAIDTLELDFKFGEIVTRAKRLRRVAVHSGEIYLLAGKHDDDRPRPPPGLGISFPALTIDQVAIRHFSLEASGSDGRQRERISHVAWSGQVVAQDSLLVQIGSAEVIWDSRDSRLTSLVGLVRFDEEGIATAGLRGFLNDSAIQVAGSRAWDGFLALELSGQQINTETVENLLDTNIGLPMAGDIEATLEAEGERFSVDAHFTGRLDEFDLEGVWGRMVITPASVVCDTLVGRVNTAWFAGHGEFGIAPNEPLVFTLEGDVADVDLTRGLIPGETDLPRTDGHGHLVIRHDAADLLTRVTGELRDGFVDIIPFEHCAFDVSATPDLLVFHNLELKQAGLQATVTGESDSSEYFRGELIVSVDELADLPAAWGWPEIHGRASGQGKLTGPLDDLTFSGRLAARQLQLGRHRAATADIDLVAEDILGEPSFSVDIEGQDIRLGGMPLGEYLVTGTVSARGARIESFRSVQGDTLVFLQGHATFSDTLQYFQVDDFSIDLEGNNWSLAQEVELWTGRNLLSLPQLTLSSSQGVLRINGLRREEDFIAGSLQLRHFDLGLLTPFLRRLDHLTGEATADVQVTGRPDTPVIKLTATITGSEFPQARVDTLVVSGSYSGGFVDLESLELVTNHGRLRGSGKVASSNTRLDGFWAAAQLDLDLNIVDTDWAVIDQFAIPALDRIAGRFSGRMHVGGTTRAPVIEGDLSSAPFHIHWLHLDRFEGKVRIEKDLLVLADLHGVKDTLELTGRIEIPLVFDLLSEPTTFDDGPCYLAFTIPENTDLTPLAAATNAFIKSGGMGAGNVVISGPLRRPLFQGQIELSEAEFVLRGLEEVYRNVSVVGVFRGDRLVLTELQGEEGLRGTFNGTGEVIFAGLELTTFDLRLQADRLLVASIPDLRVLVRTQNARIAGVKVGPDSLLVPEFTGDIEVIKARYIGDFSETAGGVDPRAGTVAPDWLADLRIRAPARSGRIANRAMELDVSGDVNLVRSLSGLYLRGSTNVDAGRFPVFNNDFRVVRGSLDFSQDVGLTPTVDLEAETRVRLRSKYSSSSVIERVTVLVTGPITAPELAFSSESGYPRAGIERMLLGLSPYDTENDTRRLANTSIAAGLNLVEREIAQELDIIDTFEIDQIDRQTDDGSQGFDPLIGVGKYMSLFREEDLYVKYAMGFNQTDRDIVLEYQINDYLVLQSELRRRLDEYQGEDTYNLDLLYRFEY